MEGEEVESECWRGEIKGHKLKGRIDIERG